MSIDDRSVSIRACLAGVYECGRVGVSCNRAPHVLKVACLYGKNSGLTSLAFFVLPSSADITGLPAEISEQTFPEPGVRKRDEFPDIPAKAEFQQFREQFELDALAQGARQRLIDAKALSSYACGDLGSSPT